MTAPPPDQPAGAAGTLALGGVDTVNRIGLGARWLDYRGPEAAGALLKRALELGVNLIDTADVYGADHASERLIAEILHPYPAGLVIATKGGQVVTDGRPGPNGRPEYLRAACEASLRRLRLDTIPLYQLHQPDPDVPLEESLGVLTELQAEGKIRHIGVSNLFRGDLDRAIELAPIVSVQNLYNLGRRASDPEVDTCARHGIAYMPWRPVFEGAIPPDGELARIAAERGATAAQVALAWLLARSEVMVPIPGTSSLAHLEENVEAARLALSGEEVARLEAYSSE